MLKLSVLCLLLTASVMAEEYLPVLNGAAMVRPAPDGANQWEPLAVGAGGQNLQLAFDPLNPDRIYLGIDVAGVIKTIDGGEHWLNSNSGLHGLSGGNYPIGDIAIDPVNPNIIYASLGRQYQPRTGIIRSLDHGENWELISETVCGFGEGKQARKGGGQGLLIDPRNPERLYAIDNKHNDGAGGLWISDDGGKNWQPSGLQKQKLSTVRFSPGNPDILYAAAENHKVNPGGLFISLDRGKNWQSCGLTGENVIKFDFDPADLQTVYAIAGLTGFFCSNDGGKNWHESNNGLPLARDGKKGQYFEYFYRVLAVDPFRPGHVIVGADVIRSYYESIDGGKSWQKFNVRGVAPKGWMLSGDHMGWHTNAIYFHPLQKDTLFLCDYFGTWKSNDGGKNWRINPYGQESSCMVTVLPDKTIPDRIYLGIWDHFMLIHRTKDGSSFVERPGGLFRRGQTNKHLSGIAQFANPPERLIAVTNSSTLFVSSDRGQNWSESAAGLPADTMYRLGGPLILADKPLAFVPVNGTAENGGGVYRSDDFGGNWSRTASEGLANVEVCSQWDPRQNTMAATANGAKLFLATKGELYISGDLGEHWQKLPVPDTVLTAAVSADGALLAAGTFKRGVMLSYDSGKNWTPAGPAGKARLLAVDGDRILAHVVATAPDQRLAYFLQYSGDGGKNWRELLNNSLPVWSLQGIAFDPFNRNVIYANTYWAGSWKSKLEAK